MGLKSFFLRSSFYYTKLFIVYDDKEYDDKHLSIYDDDNGQFVNL